MENFTWTVQPSNDRELRPPTFLELYGGEFYYSIFYILFITIIISLVKIKIKH